jgi:hypothetical protein
VNCLCNDEGDKVSTFSSADTPTGEGLSPLDVEGEEPSDPEIEDRLSGEL